VLSDPEADAPVAAEIRGAWSTSSNDKVELENFLRMEKWIFDSPDQAGEGVSPVHARFLPGQQAAQGRFAHRQA
jgi:hypothetical protein